MSQETLSRIVDGYTTYRYDKENQKVVNLKTSQETDIDEFLQIQNILDNNRVSYALERDFEIRILRNR